MAVVETSVNNRLFVVYDFDGWSKGTGWDIWGRLITVTVK
jgi:hypothetical protein